MTLAEALSNSADCQAPAQTETLAARISAAVAVAASHADAVDRDSRFPVEAFAELKHQKLLGILLSPVFGGEARSVADAAQICYELGKVCSSTSMIYAMHSANIACLSNHGDDNPHFTDCMRRIGVSQMLLASSTTEGAGGANVRSSAAPIESADEAFTLQRDASVVSYGAAADAIVTTARRSPDSLPSDQVLALLFREDYELRPTSKWDVMGMRGTCSEGFQLQARARKEQVLSQPYDRIHRRTMVPVTHLLWASTWAGIAAGALLRAQSFVRKIARAQKGVLPPGAPHVTQASLSLMRLVNLVDSAVADYLSRSRDDEALDEPQFQTSLNLLKVSASESAIETVMHAFNASGIAGYRNDSEVSIARPLRDILSSAIMINNSRILTNVSAACLIGGVPDSIVKQRREA